MNYLLRVASIRVDFALYRRSLVDFGRFVLRIDLLVFESPSQLVLV